MRAIVVRHYKTTNNVERRIMGWGDAPPAKGWERDLLQVDHVISHLDINIDAFYASALDRAHASARYYASRRGCLDVHLATELNEVNYGILYQRHKSWVSENYREYKTDADFVFPQGESFRQMQRRSVEYLLSLEKRHANDTLMLVVHAGVIRGFISHFLGLDFESNLKSKISHRYIGEFVIENGKCLFYNELGKASGFVKGGSIKIPVRQSKSIANARIPDLGDIGEPPGSLFLERPELI